jgi:hypothetical protein
MLAAWTPLARAAQQPDTHTGSQTNDGPTHTPDTDTSPPWRPSLVNLEAAIFRTTNSASGRLRRSHSNP